jgi:hypothetical protein
MWSRGCARPPSPGVEVHGVDLHGCSGGLVPTVSEGGAYCRWWQAIPDSQHVVHYPGRGSQMAVTSPLDSKNSMVPGINSLICPFHCLL